MSSLTPQQALDLALNYVNAGRLGEAEALYLQLHALNPDHPEVVHMLGLIAYQSGHLQAARERIERSVALSPQVARYHNNLGTLLLALGECERALTAFNSALALEPLNAETHYNLGVVRAALRHWPLAEEAYRRALQLNPHHAHCTLNLGIVLAVSGRLDEAIALYRAELLRRPDEVPIMMNLGTYLKEKGDLDAAIQIYRETIARSPLDWITPNNLGVALKDQGYLRDSIAAYRRSIAIDPSHPNVHSNLILTLHYDPGTPRAEIEEEERRWNRQHAAPLQAAWRPHANDRSPERRLRLGYISTDLRDHVVGRALLPVFEKHDRAQFEVICYSAARRDAITERFISGANLWRDISNASFEQIGDLIRADGIDILVDLALHTSDNCLPVFAGRPAPVQISWLGYPGSSGLDAIGHHLTDACLEPPTASSAPGALRLPDCWTCYEPPAGFPEVNALPAAGSDHVVFGSMNNFGKINDAVLELWARILNAVPDSRLALLAKTGEHRQQLIDRLGERGIKAERIEFFDYRPSTDGRPMADYLQRYHRIDLALDTFPYNGMTTTCDALWMGVPVVAMIGDRPISRASFSLLSNVGLAELATHSQDEYVATAIRLAQDLPRLAALRATLRERMRQSPLLDAASFARNVEHAYREAWRSWCARQSSPLPT